ncbi:ABC transporter permease subunit [Acidobacteria bacterium AB60]|nr:ABC transporter permease subunit [Acidobacteria bacterium AB60]
MKIQEPFARTFVTVRKWPFFIDVGVGLCALAVFFAVVHTGEYWLGRPVPVVPISLKSSSLPLYALYSVIRIGIAYVLSLGFALAYGYIAAYNKRLEPWMIAALDILQSIPVLSFLPPLLLAMIALIPTHQLGIELGVILLIFTGQVWNLAFSFYSSLKAIPREMMEASRIYRYSGWQRFWQLEMPYSAIGLVWNSIVSVANGWFALMACEMFQLKESSYQLPGLGSYIQTATYEGNMGALVAGILTMVLIVVATDQLLWRPLIAWSEKFKFEQVESADRVTSPVLELLKRSTLINSLSTRIVTSIGEPIYRSLAKSDSCRVVKPIDDDQKRGGFDVLSWIVAFAAVALVGWGATRGILLLRAVSGHELLILLAGAGATFLRVNGALLISALWTIPVGVAIGFNPRVAAVIQPVAQVLASIPATAFFPILLIGLMKIGGGLGIGAMALMLLGTQWYILFNVIAGAMSIPSDLKEAASLYRFTRWQRWRTLILPGIFPYLVTGMVTASGGAWNASVFAEYTKLQNRTLEITGLGAQISAATDSGNFPVLLIATILISLMVVTVNRLLWRRLYRLAETRYKLLG